MNAVLVALLIFAAGFGSAWSWQAVRADARIETVKLANEKIRTADATQAADDLLAASDRANEIDRAAERRESVLNAKLQEVQHALKKSTLGRPCLGGPALRLLGQSHGLSLGPLLPETTGALHGGSGAAAADPEDEGEYASDTQIADWIAGAGAQYDRCRASIGDIRSWEDR